MANATQEDAIQTGLDVIEPIEEVNDDTILHEHKKHIEVLNHVAMVLVPTINVLFYVMYLFLTL